jgi:hypothetical protein
VIHSPTDFLFQRFPEKTSLSPTKNIPFTIQKKIRKNSYPPQVLLQFKKGAFVGGKAVQPVCFRFPYTYFNPAWIGEALGGNEMMYVILKSCCQFVNRMEVRILPKYEPSADEIAKPEVFAENVRIRLLCSDFLS